MRLGDERIYRCEFTGPDGDVDVAVPNRIIAYRRPYLVGPSAAAQGASARALAR